MSFSGTSIPINHVMLPTFMSKKAIPQKPDPPPSDRVEYVYLVLPNVNRPRHLDPFTHEAGIIDGYVGEEVLLRFRDMIIKVPAEWVVPAE